MRNDLLRKKVISLLLKLKTLTISKLANFPSIILKINNMNQINGGICKQNVTIVIMLILLPKFH